MESLSKLRRPHDQCSLCLGGANNFVVGRNHRARSSILPRKPFDYLVGPLAQLGINYLNTGAMLASFERLSSLPAVKDNRQCVTLPLRVPCQQLEQ